MPLGGSGVTPVGRITILAEPPGRGLAIACGAQKLAQANTIKATARNLLDLILIITEYPITQHSNLLSISRVYYTRSHGSMQGLVGTFFTGKSGAERERS